MRHVLFYDSACPSPYASESLLGSGTRIGGAEATVVRVAEQLSLRQKVTVAQHNRTKLERTAGKDLEWLPSEDALRPPVAPDAIVILRRVGDVRRLRRHYPTTRLFVWYHDWFDLAPKDGSAKAWLLWQAKVEARVLLHARYDTVAVGVSRTHEQNIRQSLARARALGWLEGRVKVDYVYNPIADDLGPASDRAGYDPNKLVFFSAPWKGLDLVLSAFAAVRRVLPELRLYVASPGYQSAGQTDGAALENVVFLGSLPHAEVMSHVRTSLCVFYPADRIPETFGLVFAESNAVGTPVLTHPFGAAPEILTSEQLVDAHDTDAIVARLRAWRNGSRPIVAAKPEYRLARVAGSWEDLLLRGP
jgi:glycosyltransferase involved in cell wall biosynthesis